MQNIQLKEVIRNNLCTDIDSHGPRVLDIAAFAVLMLPYLGFCYGNRAKMHAKMHAKMTREGLISPCSPRCAVVKPPLFEKMTTRSIKATCRQIAAFCAVMHLEDSTRATPLCRRLACRGCGYGVDRLWQARNQKPAGCLATLSVSKCKRVPFATRAWHGVEHWVGVYIIA